MPKAEDQTFNLHSIDSTQHFLCAQIQVSFHSSKKHSRVVALRILPVEVSSSYTMATLWESKVCKKILPSGPYF